MIRSDDQQQLQLHHSIGGVVGTRSNLFMASKLMKFRFFSNSPALRLSLQKAIENVFQQEIANQPVIKGTRGKLPRDLERC